MKFTKKIFNYTPNRVNAINASLVTFQNLTNKYLQQYNDSGNEFSFIKYDILYDLHKHLILNATKIEQFDEDKYDQVMESLNNIIMFKNSSIKEKHNIKKIIQIYKNFLINRLNYNETKLETLDEFSSLGGIDFEVLDWIEQWMCITHWLMNTTNTMKILKVMMLKKVRN